MTGFVIPPGHPHYEAAVARELDFWSHRRVMNDKERVTFPASHPIVAAYLNEIQTGDPKVDWLGHILAKYQPAGVFASLGSGIGFYERQILQTVDVERFDLYELCPANLHRARHRLEQIPSNIRYLDADLNFTELEPDTYDFILCRFAMHHVVNLEFMLTQVNAALRPNGVFVVYEYVGESRYRWPADKKQFVNGLLDHYSHTGIPIHRLGTHPGDAMTAPDDPDHFSTLLVNSPFEVIRSAEIPGILDAVFGESRLFEVTYGAILQAAFRTLDYSDWENPALQDMLRLIVDLDRVTTAHGVFRPCGLLGAYGKARPKELAVEPWPEERIEAELCPMPPGR